MALPKLPYQLGKTVTVGNKQVHTRTIFSQRMSTQRQLWLQQALDQADTALLHSITRARVRAPELRNGTPLLGPFNQQGRPLVPTFSNEFLMDFWLDAAHPDAVADKMDTFRHSCVNIQRGLKEPLDIVDLPIKMQGDGTSGYVMDYMVGGVVKRKGAIHIDFDRITATNIDGAANALIHEASHKCAATRDHAYQHEQAKWRALTSVTAIENADSISRFVMKAYTNRLQ
jgi:hypothetical protein